MNRIIELKFTALGNYEKLDSSPALIAKLSNIYSKYDMLPNTITMQEINAQGVKTIYRPQLFSINGGMRIDFLKERIDIVFSYIDKNLNISESCRTANDIFDYIAECIDEIPNRFAFFVVGILENNKKSNIINQTNYYPNEEFIEWNVRSVHRKNIKMNFSDIAINIVVSMIKPENGINLNINNEQHNYIGIQYQIDINTFMPCKEKFTMNDFRSFSNPVISVVNEAIKEIEGAVDGK